MGGCGSKQAAENGDGGAPPEKAPPSATQTQQPQSQSQTQTNNDSTTTTSTDKKENQTANEANSSSTTTASDQGTSSTTATVATVAAAATVAAIAVAVVVASSNETTPATTTNTTAASTTTTAGGANPNEYVFDAEGGVLEKPQQPKQAQWADNLDTHATNKSHPSTIATSDDTIVESTAIEALDMNDIGVETVDETVTPKKKKKQADGKVNPLMASLSSTSAAEAEQQKKAEAEAEAEAEKAKAAAAAAEAEAAKKKAAMIDHPLSDALAASQAAAAAAAVHQHDKVQPHAQSNTNAAPIPAAAVPLRTRRNMNGNTASSTTSTTSKTTTNALSASTAATALAASSTTSSSSSSSSSSTSSTAADSSSKSPDKFSSRIEKEAAEKASTLTALVALNRPTFALSQVLAYCSSCLSAQSWESSFQSSSFLSAFLASVSTPWNRWDVSGQGFIHPELVVRVLWVEKGRDIQEIPTQQQLAQAHAAITIKATDKQLYEQLYEQAVQIVQEAKGVQTGQQLEDEFNQVQEDATNNLTTTTTATTTGAMDDPTFSDSDGDDGLILDDDVEEGEDEFGFAIPKKKTTKSSISSTPHGNIHPSSPSVTSPSKEVKRAQLLREGCTFWQFINERLRQKDFEHVQILQPDDTWANPYISLEI